MAVFLSVLIGASASFLGLVLFAVTGSWLMALSLYPVAFIILCAALRANRAVISTEEIDSQFLAASENFQRVSTTG